MATVSPQPWREIDAHGQTNGQTQRQTEEYTVTENSQKQSLNIGLQMIIEVQGYRSFHAKSGAIIRFILVLKIFHTVIVTVVDLQNTVRKFVQTCSVHCEKI